MNEQKLMPDELYRLLTQKYEYEHKRECLMKIGVIVLCFLGFSGLVIYVSSSKINNDN